MVVKLDAEKVFDCIEWEFLFHTLQEFGLGENVIKWVKLSYHNPSGAVITNGKCSPYFALGWGTRQGCPLFPLLFVVAIEPLAQAIPNIHGVSIY